MVAFGDADEEGIQLLRTQRVLASDGSVLFDIDAAHVDRLVEDAIDDVDVEMLDVRHRPTSGGVLRSRRVGVLNDACDRFAKGCGFGSGLRSSALVSR